jgi:hypothetical protein
VQEFAKTGIEPQMSTSIKGIGHQIGVLSGSSYLDIAAPDPEREGPVGNLLPASGVKQLRPLHWAIRTNRAEELAKEVSFRLLMPTLHFHV